MEIMVRQKNMEAWCQPHPTPVSKYVKGNVTTSVLKRLKESEITLDVSTFAIHPLQRWEDNAYMQFVSEVPYSSPC